VPIERAAAAVRVVRIEAIFLVLSEFIVVLLG
jgi:hypothetical protein